MLNEKGYWNFGRKYWHIVWRRRQAWPQAAFISSHSTYKRFKNNKHHNQKISLHTWKKKGFKIKKYRRKKISGQKIITTFSNHQMRNGHKQLHYFMLWRNIAKHECTCHEVEWIITKINYPYSTITVLFKKHIQTQLAKEIWYFNGKEFLKIKIVFII